MQAALEELASRVTEVDAAKADRGAVEVALSYKADKEAVARDTELNQRAVDEALFTMNAGTQGIQQLLERQEGAVASMVAQLSSKPSREELEALQEALEKAVAANECSAEQAEAIYGRYGTMPEDAAIMTRRLDRFNCISCNRPLKPEPRPPMPTLPLLPGQSLNRPPTAHIPARKSSIVPACAPLIYCFTGLAVGGRGSPAPPLLGFIKKKSSLFFLLFFIPFSPRRPPRPMTATGTSVGGDSLVEMMEIPGSLRSTGGAHTSPRKVAMARAGSAVGPRA
jgi:hypothetical protein